MNSMLGRLHRIPRSCTHSITDAQIRLNSTTAASGDGTNFILRLLGYYGTESTRLRNSEAIFQSCVNQSAKKGWFSHGGVKNEFRPRHALLISHVWLVHRRLMLEDKPGKLMEEAVFDLLWEDTTVRIRSMGISELSVNKNLADVQKYSFPMLVGYDQALGKPVKDNRLDHLGAAAWRNLWLADGTFTVEHCMEMAHYLQREMETLKGLDTESFYEGRIPWGPLPNWHGVKMLVDGPEVDLSTKLDSADQEEAENSDWRETLAPNGKLYYWNVRTRESSWEKPPL